MAEDTIDDLKRRLQIAEAELAERANHDAAWRESEGRLAAAFASVPVGIGVFDRDGKAVLSNDEFRRFLPNGIMPSRDPERGRYWQAWDADGRLIPPHEYPSARALRGERVIPGLEMLYTDEDGRTCWTNVATAPTFDVGRVTGCVAVISDITDRKRAETTLRESESRLRTLFNSIDEGYAEFDVILDEEGQVIDWRYVAFNAAFNRLTGMDEATVRGRLISEIVPELEPEWSRLYTRIIKTGEPVRFEQQAASLGQWYEVYAARAGGPDSLRIVVVYNDVTERKRAETVLRESEERQAFLLKLSDTLRPLADPDAVQLEGMRVLVQHLGVARAEFWEFDPDDPGYQTSAGAYAPGVAPFPQRVRSADYGPVTEYLQAGDFYIIRDSRTDPHLTKEDSANLVAIEIGAALGVPLIKEGRLVAALGVYSPTPRDWSPSDLALSAELVDRVWEAVLRARAELRLRESEARFQQFANASSGALWMRDAETLAMEFVSPAISAIYGIEPDALLGDIRQWASLVVPDDRGAALEYIEQARAGTPVVHEFRIQRPSDGSFRWVRDTDFPLFDDKGDVQRIGGIAEDVSENKQLTEHQRVLLAELQHRVRNIMGMIRSIANRSAIGATSVDDYRSILEGRLMAISRVQALLTREANAGGSLREVIRSEISAQAHTGEQFQLTGPEVMLSPKAVEVLTLAFHELTTNALKYGGLSGVDGRVRVRWEPFERRGRRWLGIDWMEDGGPVRPPSQRRGFGSELIEARIPYELHGSGKVTIEPQGARCRIEFPLDDAESILETDAPAPTTVFGGSIDMVGAPDLKGQSVLVVEDDYYMAMDTTAALRGAGAEVLGPCPREDDTRLLLESAKPTAAVVDLNLGGGGPKFEIARLLKALGVPFVFLTGYDPGVIPDELADIERLQKPIPLRDVVEAIARLRL